MKVIDMHCDTLYELMRGANECSLAQNELCINRKGMEQAEMLAQFFACFVNARECEAPPESKTENIAADSTEKRMQGIAGNGKGGLCFSGYVWDMAYGKVRQMLERLRQEEDEKFRQAFSYADIMRNREQDIISAVAAVEEGGVLNGDIERLEELYREGVRLITLTWNYENCLAYPNSRDEKVMRRGLKPFGLEVIRQMNESGIIVDVSHLSDGGFWDCIRYTGKPIVASHSNCRDLCNHPRNLTDEMIRALAEKGGVTGLNFYPFFLTGEKTAVLADLARHAKHMMQTGGEDVVAIGTDFDGYQAEENPDYIFAVKDMERVWDAFYKAGISERQLDKIMSGNVLRVMKDVWK